MKDFNTSLSTLGKPKAYKDPNNSTSKVYILFKHFYQGTNKL